VIAVEGWVASRATVARYLAGDPMHRFGKLEEVAGSNAFETSDDTAFMTGHGFKVDGGI
jgi:NAD(P)-dependent dehydrogenase (short-subunit alcohol dehydrogenase family)